MTEIAVAAAPESPYKGLAPFEDNDVDALLFFGRERESEIIASNLLASRLTVLYGPSGVGKSSVLRAGVAYRLRRASDEAIAERGHPDLCVVVFDDWRGDPAGALRAAVEHELGRVFGMYALPQVELDASLAEALTAWSSALDCELLLVLDQLEEYFVYHPDEHGGDAFADELAELVTAPGLRVRVLLSLREDALAKLDRFKARIPHLLSNYLRLDRLQPAAARAAVLGPLERYNELVGADRAIAIERGLVEAVVDETAAGRVELGETGRPAQGMVGADGVETAYLQLVLARVWDEEMGAGSRILRVDTLRSLGGAGEVVRNHVRRALDELGPGERDIAATIFNYLVTPSGTKIAHALSDLEKYASASADRVDSVVSTLSRERVLRPVAAPGNGNGTSGRGYEIFHDVLGDAVLAWRRRHEEERALERERRQSRRRQRILAAVSGASLAALALMAAVTVWAFSQRAEAREQAALARLERANAVNEAKDATAARKAAQELAVKEAAARKDAQRAEKEAVEQAEIAATKEQEAEEQAQLAAKRKQDAEAQAEIAAENEQEAEDQEQIAAANEQKAEAQAELALENEQKAEKQAQIAAENEQEAEEQARRARARAFTARAFASLATDPEASLSYARRAAELGGSAQLQEALRRAVLSVRGEGVFDGGGGVVRSVAFSPDGLLLATAAMGGQVRIFDLQARRLARILRHRQPVVRAGFSPDGQRLVTAAHDGAARIWNVGTGTLLHELRHDRPVVRHAAFSPDGRSVLTAGNDRSVRLWDAATGLEIWRIPHEAVINSVTFSRPAGKFVATAAGRLAQVFRTDDRTRIARLSHGATEITSASFSPDGESAGSVLVTTARNETARIWSANSWQQTALLRGHRGQVLDAGFSENGATLATASTDGTVRVWDVASGDLNTVLIGHRISVDRVMFARDTLIRSDSIVTASKDGTARVWTVDGTRHIALLGHGREEIKSVAVAPGGDVVVTGSEDGTARLWNARVDEYLRPVATHATAATRVSFSPDGGRILSAGGSDAVVSRVGGGAPVRFAHDEIVTTATFGRRGALVLTASGDRARVWGAEGRLVRTLTHGARVHTAGFSGDARLVVTAGADRRAVIWRAGRRVQVLAHPRAVTSASFHPDGAQVLTVAGNVAYLWRVRDGRRLHSLRLHTATIVAAAFSPNGRRIATASEDETAAIWDARTGKHLRTFGGDDGHSDRLTSVAFSRDGSRVVTASEDRDAILWSIRTGRRTLLRGHAGEVRDAAFSRDGRWVVTAGPVAAGIWNARTGELLFFVREYRAGGRAVAFSPVTYRIATAAADGSVKTYDCRVCGGMPELLRIARTQLRVLRPVG